MVIWSCDHASANECVYTYMCMHTLLCKKGFQMAQPFQQRTCQGMSDPSVGHWRTGGAGVSGVRVNWVVVKGTAVLWSMKTET